jgi:DNA repair photolyase
MSPGVDFESRLFAKPNAAALLAKELSAPGYVPKVIAMGTNTDPYQPIEGRWRVTRSVVELLAETRHPLTITTKSDRVTRDIDLLGPMAAEGLACVAISITSLTPEIARTLYPGLESSSRSSFAASGLANRRDSKSRPGERS